MAERARGPWQQVSWKPLILIEKNGLHALEHVIGHAVVESH